jgi:hypothetical protein
MIKKNELNSISGNFDKEFKSELINKATINGTYDEVFTIDYELNLSKNHLETTNYKIINNNINNLIRNDQGFLVLNNLQNDTIQAGLITKKFKIKEIKQKIDTKLNNIA